MTHVNGNNNNNNISLLSNSNQLFNNKTIYVNHNNNLSYLSSYLKVNYDPYLINNTFRFNLHSPLKHKYVLFNEASLSFNAHNLISVPNDIHTGTATHTIHNHSLLNYKALANPNNKCTVNKPLEYLLTEQQQQQHIVSSLSMGTNLSLLTHHPNKSSLKHNRQMIYMNDIACNYKVKGSFDKKDLVERLFECPCDKYVVLTSEEAGKVGGMLIELMRKENELKSSLDMSNLQLEKMNAILNEYKTNNKDDKNNNGVNILMKEMEMKRTIVERYVKDLENKIEESKNIFETTNCNYEIDTEINEIQNGILNEINKDLQMLTT